MRVVSVTIDLQKVSFKELCISPDFLEKLISILLQSYWIADSEYKFDDTSLYFIFVKDARTNQTFDETVLKNLAKLSEKNREHYFALFYNYFDYEKIFYYDSDDWKLFLLTPSFELEIFDRKTQYLSSVHDTGTYYYNARPGMQKN